MSNNPYVSIDRVLDTSLGQRKIVEFLHQKTFTNIDINLSRFAAVDSSELAEGNFFVDIKKNELTYDSKFVLKENHIPIILLSTDNNLTLDKDNFPTCKTLNNGTEVVVRLYASQFPTSVTVNKITIPVIMLTEVK